MGGLYLTAQQPPCRMLGSAALGGVFGFVLVVVGLVVFDDVVLATEESDHTWKEKTGRVSPWPMRSSCPFQHNQKRTSRHATAGLKLSDPPSINTPVLTCPHDKHHHDDDELPCPQLGCLAHFLHRHFV